ncbi:hypothetical protein BdWA1_002962 [Babesia duncani]|uniref:Uncharacterized protein n=1 Tax=Babesia duncani TaxID=323732 RepID=A0AAD9PIF4_9APIC|nr:hypothetical protein BdWA1_002962 [Babesia duncani]
MSPTLTLYRIKAELPHNNDEDIVKRIEESQRRKIMQYMDPMSSANIRGVSERELIDTFGVPSTAENLRQREIAAEEDASEEPPDVPPTNKLPYFVNLERPDKPLGDLQFVQETSTNSVENEGITDDVPTTYTSHGSVITGPDSGDAKNVQAEFDEFVEKTRVIPHGNQNIQEDEESVDEASIALNNDAVDPLLPLMEASDSEDDDDEEYEKERKIPEKPPLWYYKREIKGLSPIDLEDGWSILPCGKIYKRLLRPTIFDSPDNKVPKPTSCVTFAFKILNAITGDLILESKDLEGDMLVSYMEELDESHQRCLASMEAGEQAEFVLHISEAELGESECEELENVEWLRYWFYLWEVHEPNERWWGLGPADAELYPKIDENNNLTKIERLDMQAEELKKNIEVGVFKRNIICRWNYQSIQHLHYGKMCFHKCHHRKRKRLLSISTAD